MIREFIDNQSGSNTTLFGKFKWHLSIFIFHALNEWCELFHKRHWFKPVDRYSWYDADFQPILWCEKCDDRRYENMPNLWDMMFKEFPLKNIFSVRILSSFLILFLIAGCSPATCKKGQVKVNGKCFYPGLKYSTTMTGEQILD